MSTVAEEYLTPKEVAKLWGVSMEHIIRLINAKCLPAMNVARPGAKKARWRIRDNDRQAYENSRMNQGSEVYAKRKTVKSTDPRMKGVKEFV